MRKVATTVKITGTDISLFQSGKAQGKGVIAFCDIRPVPSASDDDIGKLLKEMLSALPVSPDEVIFLVPRRLVILKQMKLPSHNPEEIDDMIGLQLVNTLPYPIEDVIYRHVVLERNNEGGSRVLVIIIHKEVSRRYCRILHGARIKNGRLVPDSLGFSNWLGYQEKAHHADDCQPVMLVNISSGHSDICFCQGTKLFFSRSIPYGEEQLRSAGASELLNQVQLSLGAYQKEGLGADVKKMLILSTAEKSDVLGKRLEEASGVPAAVMDPLKDVFCSQSMDQTVLRTCRPSSITAELGFLLGDTKDLVNLTPMEIHEEKKKNLERRRVAELAFLLLIAAVLTVLGQFVDIHKRKTRLEALKSEIDSLKLQLEDVRRKRQLVEYFDQKLAGYRFIPDLIDELNRLTPEDISFRALSLDKQRNLLIQGYAQTQSIINDFQARLVHSSRFSAVDLQFATKRKIANMAVTDFKIVSRLSGKEENAL